MSWAYAASAGGARCSPRVSDRDAVRAPDLVNRDFTADRPDALWVTDLTYVATRAGMAYVCFIVDAFSRRIVGWRVASHMRTEMVLDALEMARRSRGGRRLVGLVAHSDAGSQFTSLRFTERLDEIGARPSIGTVADSYDNALAETTNGLYKAECAYGPDTRRLARHRPARTRHPGLGALVQPATAPWPLQRHPASRIRSSVLRCPQDHPNRGWKTKPMSLQQSQSGSVWCVWACWAGGAGVVWGCRRWVCVGASVPGCAV